MAILDIYALQTEKKISYQNITFMLLAQANKFFPHSLPEVSI